jgi:hypothetical protein
MAWLNSRKSRVPTKYPSSSRAWPATSAGSSSPRPALVSEHGRPERGRRKDERVGHDPELAEQPELVAEEPRLGD